MKTPDEIKKSLECCITDRCMECPYYPQYMLFKCKTSRTKDAIGLIQQLEERVNVLTERNVLYQTRIDDLELFCAKTSTWKAENDLRWLKIIQSIVNETSNLNNGGLGRYIPPVIEGTPLFSVESDEDGSFSIRSSIVTDIWFNQNGWFFVENDHIGPAYQEKDIGKRIYLSYEEAEAKCVAMNIKRRSVRDTGNM